MCSKLYLKCMDLFPNSVQLVNLRHEEVHRRRIVLQKQDFTNAVIVADTSVQTCEKLDAFLVKEVLLFDLPVEVRNQDGHSPNRNSCVCLELIKLL